MDNKFDFMHWAFQYLGRKWSADPRPPVTFHCWALTRYVQSAHYNRDCPDYGILNPADMGMLAQAIKRAKDSGQWIKLDKPIDGCISALSNVGDSVHHVGTYLDVDGGRILHCAERIHTVAQSPRELRKIGISLAEYYIHKSWRT